MQNLVKYSQLVFGIGLFLLVNSANADVQLRSDFAFSFNNDVFKAPEWDPKNYLLGTKQMDIPGFDVQTPLPTHVNVTHANVMYEFVSDSNQITLGQDRNLTSKSFDIAATITQIVASGNMEFPVPGGGTIIVRVDATCNNIPVRLKPGAGQMQAVFSSNIDVNGRVALSLPWISWTMAPDAWDVGAFTCIGTQGFDVEIKKHLVVWLNDKNRWDALLRSKIGEELVDLQNKINSELMQVREIANSVNDFLGQIKVRMAPSRVDFAPNSQLILSGKMIIDMESNEVNSQDIPFGLPVANTQPFKLYLPDELFLSLLSFASRAKPFTSPVLGEKFTAFKNLKDSVTTAWLVWPEINRFDSVNDFKFNFEMRSPLQAAMEAGPTTEGPANGSFAANLRIQTNVYKRGVFNPMIHFFQPLTSKFTILVQNQNFYMRFISPKGTLTSAWDSSYRPFDSTIKTSTLGDSLIKSLTTAPGQALFSMPPMKLNSQMTLKAQSLLRRGNLLVIKFQ